MEIKIPGLSAQIGAGDVIKKVASALGIEQKPGCGCQKRQASLNRALTFAPPKPQALPQPPSSGDRWTVPPFAPEGWTLLEQCEAAMFFTNGKRYLVWSIENGQYTRSHSDCCSQTRARKRFEERCPTNHSA